MTAPWYQADWWQWTLIGLGLALLVFLFWFIMIRDQED